jgi:TonB-dependent starch-binding outer membrane protein SusC
MTRLHRWFVLTACIGALGPNAAAAQNTGVITGRVTQSGAEAKPIANATVMVVGTKIGVRTNNEGRYRITGVTQGSHQLRAMHIGFESATQTVSVAGDSTTADFSLRQVATSLEAVVTSATGETQRKRETGNAVATMAPDSVQKAAVASLSDILSSRVAGVTVFQASGTTGGGSRIRIRGNNSISLQNNPLIIVDGVRVNSNDKSSSLDIGGQAASRLDDLNPEDIENIEILRGPAAAALYGTAAANGVIQITTKRGRAGAPRWDSHLEYGSVRNVTTFPANWANPGITPGGSRVSRCTLYFQAALLT